MLATAHRAPFRSVPLQTLDQHPRGDGVESEPVNMLHVPKDGIRAKSCHEQYAGGTEAICLWLTPYVLPSSAFASHHQPPAKRTPKQLMSQKITKTRVSFSLASCCSEWDFTLRGMFAVERAGKTCCCWVWNINASLKDFRDHRHSKGFERCKHDD